MSFSTSEELRVATLEQYVESLKDLVAGKLDHSQREYFNKKVLENAPPE